jgi:hypothetical protein
MDRARCAKDPPGPDAGAPSRTFPGGVAWRSLTPTASLRRRARRRAPSTGVHDRLPWAASRGPLPFRRVRFCSKGEGPGSHKGPGWRGRRSMAGRAGCASFRQARHRAPACGRSPSRARRASPGPLGGTRLGLAPERRLSGRSTRAGRRSDRGDLLGPLLLLQVRAPARRTSVRSSVSPWLQDAPFHGDARAPGIGWVSGGYRVPGFDRAHPCGIPRDTGRYPKCAVASDIGYRHGIGCGCIAPCGIMAIQGGRRTRGGSGGPHSVPTARGASFTRCRVGSLERRRPRPRRACGGESGKRTDRGRNGLR